MIGRTLLHLAAVVLTLTSVLDAAGVKQGRAVARTGATGRIVGRVTDTRGLGVAGVFVSVLQERERDARGAPPLHPVSVRLYSITNERGEFRLEKLAPGGYCVVAMPRNPAVTAENQPSRSGHAITYYPGTTVAKDARFVIVPRGTEATADIRLVQTRLSVVSGSVTGSNGQPGRNARLSIALGDGLFGLDGTSTNTRPDGTFALAGLPPGTYFLHMREGVWPPPRDVIPKVSVAKVVVVDRDVTDVRVLPLPMVRATGRVTVDPADRKSLQPSSILVGARPVDFNGNPGPSRPGTLRDDLSFEFRIWPGLGDIIVSPASQWFVRRVRLNGVDVTSTGIDFRAGGEITGLEIELSKGSSR